jgi:ethanolamine utilization protein EutA
MHETDFDHDHEELYALATDIEGMEQLTLTSVGIDIGSATTHMLFSRLVLRKWGGFHSTKFHIVEREMLWSSPVLLTPYLSQTRIDIEQVLTFIGNCYERAGLTPDNVNSGVVVITGEALKKENAEPLAGYVAQQGGRFVCASAGPHHEAMLAAYGSGAVELSALGASRVVNVDIGGGTTKLSLIQEGKILETAALNIGARLIAFEASGNINRLEGTGAILARASGYFLKSGEALAPSATKKIGSDIAALLVDVLRGSPSPLAQTLFLTEPLSVGLDTVDHVIFSGGVAQYIYGDDMPSFGDLGPALGAALRSFATTLAPGMLLEPKEALRATVIGASDYTIQVSGVTNFAAGNEYLPLRNLKAIPLTYRTQESFASALAGALSRFDAVGWGKNILLSISIDGDIGYTALRLIADGIAQATRHDPTMFVAINIEQDVAHSLGTILKNELQLSNPLLVIDGIAIGELDYIDIGPALGPAGVYPVTVKSLLFSSDPLL